MEPCPRNGRRVILIGLDGLMPEEIDRYQNRVPEMKKLVREGFFSPAIPSAVTCTATNWPTIATGAWMGTHGCIGFNVHLPGMKIGETTPTFNSRLCQAEYFWHAAERQGKRSILINYPTAFPKLLKNGVVIGGDGLNSPTWAVRGNDFISSFQRKDKRLVLQPAKGWKNVPSKWKVLHEGFVDLADQARFGWDAMGMTDEGTVADKTSERRYVLVFRDGRKTKLALTRSRDASKPLAVLEGGQWSGWIEERFGKRKCMRQYKALDLSPDGKKISIFEEEGWLKLHQDRKTGNWDVDTKRTKACYAGSAPAVWLNVKGREKHGCVASGAEYERLRQQIIDRLQQVRDPETGEQVFDVVARREAFEPLGAWGERVPDVFCYAKPYYLFWDPALGMTPRTTDLPDRSVQFFREKPEVVPLNDIAPVNTNVGTLSAVHWHLPVPALSYASTRGTFILRGPGIKRGERIDRVNLVDVAATLAHVLGIDPPAQCEGRVIREAFQGGPR